MSAHLPECPLLERCDDDVAEHGYCSMQRGVFCIHCHQWCACDRLRACEQRVREEECQKPRTIQISDMNYTHNMGYAAGVQAAREAVDAVPPIDQRVDDNGLISLVYDKGDVLAAIDALKEQS